MRNFCHGVFSADFALLTVRLKLGRAQPVVCRPGGGFTLSEQRFSKPFVTGVNPAESRKLFRERLFSGFPHLLLGDCHLVSNVILIDVDHVLHSLLPMSWATISSTLPKHLLGSSLALPPLLRMRTSQFSRNKTTSHRHSWAAV